jgi:flavodoxin
METYEIIEDIKGDLKGIKCFICGLTSWNINDVEQKYCGNCHQFHDILQQQEELQNEQT